MRTTSLVLLSSLALGACGTAVAPGTPTGLPALKESPAFAVHSSNFDSTSFAFLDADGELIAEQWITSGSLPVGHLGQAYAARLTAVGGKAPYRWVRSGGSLAPGLRLTTTGRLTGIPKRTGSYRLRAKVVDRAGAVRVRSVLLRIA